MTQLNFRPPRETGGPPLILAFTCHTCHHTHSAAQNVKITSPPSIVCPQCGTTYIWVRSRTGQAPYWHQPYSRNHLVIFPTETLTAVPCINGV